MLCPSASYFICCLLLSQPSKTPPDMTEKLLTGKKGIKNKPKQKCKNNSFVYFSLSSAGSSRHYIPSNLSSKKRTFGSGPPRSAKPMAKSASSERSRFLVGQTAAQCLGNASSFLAYYILQQTPSHGLYAGGLCLKAAVQKVLGKMTE